MSEFGLWGLKLAFGHCDEHNLPFCRYCGICPFPMEVARGRDEVPAADGILHSPICPMVTIPLCDNSDCENFEKSPSKMTFIDNCFSTGCEMYCNLVDGRGPDGEEI